MFECMKSNKNINIDELNILLNQLSRITNNYHKEVDIIIKKIKKLDISKKEIYKNVIKNNIIYEKELHYLDRKPIKLYELLDETIYEDIVNSSPIRQRGMSAPPILISHINNKKDSLISMV